MSNTYIVHVSASFILLFYKYKLWFRLCALAASTRIFREAVLSFAATRRQHWLFAAHPYSVQHSVSMCLGCFASMRVCGADVWVENGRVCVHLRWRRSHSLVYIPWRACEENTYKRIRSINRTRLELEVAHSTMDEWKFSVSQSMAVASP